MTAALFAVSFSALLDRPLLPDEARFAAFFRQPQAD
jgi:hypothetical protein